VYRSWEYLNGSYTHEIEIGTAAAQFLEKEYRNGIFVAVQKESCRAAWPGKDSQQAALFKI
jgi:hypothetical protein